MSPSENGKKINIGPDFQPFGRNLPPEFVFVSFLSTSSKTLFQAIILWNLKETNKPNLREWFLISGPILAPLAPNLASEIFFESSSSASC